MAHRIDVHHHILPASYVDVVGAQKIGAQGSSGRLPRWGIEDALQKMDAAGIRTAMTSVSAPGLDVADARQAVRLARVCNDFAADMVRAHPGRFGMFATLPVADMQAAIAEFSYAVDQLAADGACLLSNHRGVYLGEASMAPLYEELNRLGSVVFVHPTSPTQPVPIAGLSASSLDFTFDTARAIASLIFTGTLRRFPRIRFIFSHMGGAMPYIAHRIEVLARNNPALQAHIPDGIHAELRKCYFDTALSANPATFGAMREIASVDNLLFGTDYPFGPADQMDSAVLSLESLQLAPGDLHLIEEGNALKLFPRLAA